MGVLMRGVDMPKNCEECNFKGECRDYWEKIREAYTRPSWCPLVEVADRKTEPTCSKMEQVDKPQTDCNGCKFVGTYDTEFPCANCSRKTKDYYATDEPQTEREGE